MKKIVILVIAFILLPSLCFGAVGYKKDGVMQGTATDIDLKRDYATFDGSTVSIYGSGYAGGVTTNVSTESNLTSAALAYGVVSMNAGIAKTITLTNGVEGQMLTLIGGTIAGTITIAPASFPLITCTKTGWTTIAITATHQSITLLYFDDTIGWVIIGNAGATIT